MKFLLPGLIILSLGFAVAPVASAAGEVRIALISDTHTTRGTKGDQPLYAGRLNAVIAAVNEAKVDFALVAGDLTDDSKPASDADYLAQISRLKAPVFWVPGNHDLGPKAIAGGKTGPLPRRLAAYEARFGDSFYVKSCAGVRIIGVNSQIPGGILPAVDAQWAMLEKALAAPVPEHTVVFMHMPPFLKTADEGSDPYWNWEPEPRKRLLALLRRGRVKTVLTGHLHYELTNHLGDMLIYTTPPVSFGLPRGVAPQGWTLVTLPKSGEARIEFKPIND